MDNIISLLQIIIFFALPVGAIIWFVVSLVGFFVNRPKRAEQPDRFKRWRRSLIASAITAGVVVGIIVGILALLAVAVSHM